MSDSVVLDSSALLALLNDEPGGRTVAASLGNAVISSVNYAEVVAKLAENGFDAAEIDQILDDIIPDIRSFDRPLAAMAGLLRPTTRQFGLSLGDRACLALGVSLKAPILTCDRIWADIDPGAIEGTRIIVAR